MPSEGLFIDVTGGMVLAKHPERPQLPAGVAVTDSKTSFNTIRAPLLAIACWKLPDDFFAFDSSLVDPVSRQGFLKFFELRKDLGVLDADGKTKLLPPISIFGHTDPVGSEIYNNVLSGRRSRAVYATLVHDVEIWEDLHKHPHGNDTWDVKAEQTMLGPDSLKDANGAPYFDGPATGFSSPKWTAAVKHFQTDKSAKVTGSFSTAADRAVLFDAYMNFLCTDDQGVKTALSKTDDFLAGNTAVEKDKATGKDVATLRGDLQGCSKFNLQMVFAKDEEAKLGEKQRNEDNKINRRVVAYLFKPGSKIDPAQWPCPPVSLNDNAAVKAVAKCAERFWSDKPRGEKKKRVKGEPRRHFKDTQDTFECRFYHGFGLRSPCEDKLKLWVIQLNKRGKDGQRVPIPAARCVVKSGAEADAVVIRTDTSKDGLVHLPVVDDKTTMTLKIDAFDAPKPLPPGTKLPPGVTPPVAPAGGDPEAEVGEDQFFQITFDAGALEPLPQSGKADLAVKQRLHNLGFGPADLSTWTDPDTKAAVQEFRAFRNKSIPPNKPLANNDDMDEPDFRDALREEYGDNDAAFQPPENG